MRLKIVSPGALPGPGTRVFLDERDITSQLHGLSIEMKTGSTKRVVLDLFVDDLDIDIEFDEIRARRLNLENEQIERGKLRAKKAR